MDIADIVHDNIVSNTSENQKKKNVIDAASEHPNAASSTTDANSDNGSKFFASLFRHKTKNEKKSKKPFLSIQTKLRAHSNPPKVVKVPLSPRKKWKDVLDFSKHQLNTTESVTSSVDSYSHLVVMQHGLHGTEKDFMFFQTILNQSLNHSKEMNTPEFETKSKPTTENGLKDHSSPQRGQKVLIHIAKCNATDIFRTHDGIDTGGRRLAQEITQVAAKFFNISHFSIIGHSLGGLYARYAIGVLYTEGFFQKIRPLNFITMATPHLGIRRPNRGSFNFLFNSIAPKLFSRTGSQLTLTDHASGETIDMSMGKVPHPETIVNQEEQMRSSTSAVISFQDVVLKDVSSTDLLPPNISSASLEENTNKRSSKDFATQMDNMSEFHTLSLVDQKFTRHIWFQINKKFGSKTFSGEELLKWMETNGMISSRMKGIELGCWLLLGKMIESNEVNASWEFEDTSTSTYKCTRSEQDSLHHMGDGSQSMGHVHVGLGATDMIQHSKCYGMITIKTSRVGVFQEKFCVVDAESPVLYCYDTKNDLHPCDTFYLFNATVKICINRDSSVDIVLETFSSKHYIELKITNTTQRARTGTSHDDTHEIERDEIEEKNKKNKKKNKKNKEKTEKNEKNEKEKKVQSVSAQLDVVGDEMTGFHRTERKDTKMNHSLDTQWRWLVHIVGVGVICTTVVDLRLSDSLPGEPTGVSGTPKSLKKKQKRKDSKRNTKKQNADHGNSSPTVEGVRAKTESVLDGSQRNVPLLVCLTKGNFLLALKQFQNRCLYSNIFYDFQVPYSSSAIRSHNPYRGDPTGCPTSSIYIHIALQSLTPTRSSDIPTQRNIQREILKSRSHPLRHFIPNHQQQEPPLPEPPLPEPRDENKKGNKKSHGGYEGLDLASSSSSLLSLPFRSAYASSACVTPVKKKKRNKQFMAQGITPLSISSPGGLKSLRIPRRRSSTADASTTFTSTSTTTTSTTNSTSTSTSTTSTSTKNKHASVLGKSEPHIQESIDGDGSTVILDNVSESFCSDPQRDSIRSMLLSLQSIGWHRIDVIFDGILAHERIIAKRAHLYSSEESGIDVACHVADTFLLE